MFVRPFAMFLWTLTSWDCISMPGALGAVHRVHHGGSGSDILGGHSPVSLHHEWAFQGIPADWVAGLHCLTFDFGLGIHTHLLVWSTREPTKVLYYLTLLLLWLGKCYQGCAKFVSFALRLADCIPSAHRGDPSARITSHLHFVRVKLLVWKVIGQNNIVQHKVNGRPVWRLDS